MDQASIIRDLLNWLDTHLDQPLTLDDVAVKAGYSKWHLQRMFKKVTNQSIGSYIRARRLSRAALALRLTSRSILDIALLYRFDSQQTFTRAFKHQFGQTPASYRRKNVWNFQGFCPPIRLDDSLLPRVEKVQLETKQLIGITQCYSCPLSDITNFLYKARRNYWSEYLAHCSSLPPMIYGLIEASPSHDKEDEHKLFYTIAVDSDEFAHAGQSSPIIIPGGKYAKVVYEGPSDGLQNFLITVYDVCFPMMSISRRAGADIERYHVRECSDVSKIPQSIYCEYLIPIL